MLRSLLNKKTVAIGAFLILMIALGSELEEMLFYVAVIIVIAVAVRYKEKRGLMLKIGIAILAALAFLSIAQSLTIAERFGWLGAAIIVWAIWYWRVGRVEKSPTEERPTDRSSSKS